MPHSGPWGGLLLFPNCSFGWMGFLAMWCARARPSAQTPINMSGNCFGAHVRGGGGGGGGQNKILINLSPFSGISKHL